MTIFLHILGPGTEAVLLGGHVLGLKSNRRDIGVPRVNNGSTYRYSSQTAV